MSNKNLIMDPNRLKKAREDLWPVFLNIMKEDAPDYHEMIKDGSEIEVLLEQFSGKLKFKVDKLPERAQKLIHKATQEAKERAKLNAKTH